MLADWRASQAGADINAVDGKDEYGDMPMHRAARRGHVVAIKTLASLGGDVNTPNNDGATLIYMCLMVPRMDVKVTDRVNPGLAPATVANTKPKIA